MRNDDSLVLELSWRDVAFVFTGDIGKAVEPRVAEKLAPVRLRVLKVPHHGSLTSSSDRFVAAVHPADGRDQRRPREPFRASRPCGPGALSRLPARRSSGPTWMAPSRWIPMGGHSRFARSPAGL